MVAVHDPLVPVLFVAARFDPLRDNHVEQFIAYSLNAAVDKIIEWHGGNLYQYVPQLISREQDADNNSTNTTKLAAVPKMLDNPTSKLISN